MPWSIEPALPDFILAPVWPLCRLLLGLAAGLLIANLLESLRWTDFLAKITTPISRLGHLGPASTSAFALAFISSTAANGLLSEKYDQGVISLRELVIASMFNGLPSFLTHTPAIFFLAWPALGSAACAYVGLTLTATLIKLGITILLGRIILATPDNSAMSEVIQTKPARLPQRLRAGMRQAWQRFCRRMPKMILATAPIYLLVYYAQSRGLFNIMENWLADHLSWLAIVKPQALGIVILQLAAEMGAALGAAGAALQEGALAPRDVVLAMLAGNVLATPIRALRHQFPAYAGFYRPGTAIAMITANQSLRGACMIAVIIIYAIWQ